MFFKRYPYLLLISFLLFTPGSHTKNSAPPPLKYSNAGTVLFGASDMGRDCWNSDSLALLSARLVIENVLPQMDEATIHVKDDAFVCDLIEYLRMVLEVVRQLAGGKAKHVLLMALSDAIGGYMKHLILPMAKYAYYAGNIEYANVIKLYQLFDEIKGFLRTNGEGWSKPLATVGKHIHARPIDLSTPARARSSVDPCAGLIYVKRSNKHSAQGMRKRGAAQIQGGPGKEPETCGLDIPMPFFDSKTHPSAVAVPFKSFTLRNLESRSSAYILVKYYVAAAKCHVSKHSDAHSVEHFNSNLFSFIMRKVMPHLCDEKFYAAFGGVLRIAETIKQSSEGSVIGNFNLMPEVEEKEPEEVEQGECAASGAAAGTSSDSDKGKSGADASGGTATEDGESSKSKLLLIAALCTIIVWFCMGAIFIWCKMRKNRKNKGLGGDDKLKLLPCTTESCPENPINKRLSANILGPLLKKSSTSKPPSAKTSSKTSDYSGEPCTNETCPGYASGKSTENEDDDTSTNRGKTTSSKLTSGTGTSGPESETDQGGKETIVQNIRYLPPIFACHTSMTGNMRGDLTDRRPPSRETSGNDSPTAGGAASGAHGAPTGANRSGGATGGGGGGPIRRNATIQRATTSGGGALPKKPYVFGYDFQTTSDEDDSSQGSTDGDNDIDANMSK